jgi:hypothetical protein
VKYTIANYKRLLKKTKLSSEEASFVKRFKKIAMANSGVAVQIG